MTSFLVAFGTGTGQTAKVARYLDSVLSARGHAVTTRHVTNVPEGAVSEFDAVLVGASINFNRPQPAVVRFVEENRDALATRPSGYFQLSFASAVPWSRARDGAMEWADDLIADTGWQPDRVGLFAGAVEYTRYSRPTKLFFRLLSMVTTGDTDTSRDYEYTDWDKVERFALEFADFAASRSRRGPLASIRSSDVVRRGRRALLALALLEVAGAAVWLASRRWRARRRPGDVSGREAALAGTGTGPRASGGPVDADGAEGEPGGEAGATEAEPIGGDE